MWEAQEAYERMRRPTSPPKSHTPEARALELTEGQQEDDKPKRGVWLPHPDDEFLRLFLERRGSSSRAEKTSAQPIARPE